MEFLVYVLAMVVGFSLGLIGGGGSILTVPILVYLLGIDPVLATAYSLFIVGITSLIGGMQKARQQMVDFKSVFVFGLPSIVSVYLTRAFLLPLIPEILWQTKTFILTKNVVLMLLFAGVMVLASVSMIRPCKTCNTSENNQLTYNYPMILLEGIVVGTLTGLVGAGGGFLIIPALVLFAKMPMKLAIGTSLFIIAFKSILGFIGDLQNSFSSINWQLLFTFTLLSVVGIFFGNLFSKDINGKQLKSAFGWFVLVMGIYILIKEIVGK